MRRSRFPLSFLLAVAVVSCGTSNTEQLEANKNLARQFVAALNAADWDALDALLAEDFRRHSQATSEMPELDSREEFKGLQQMYLESFPDQRVTIEMLVAEGDKVAGLATYAGTNTGPLGNFAATGKSAELRFLSIFRIQDGRIAELWVEWDNLAMLTQLGLFPPPELAADRLEGADIQARIDQRGRVGISGSPQP
ncbi:MAG: ester cyclase [Gemmatimonadota bacterium]|nr:MAG: ester cyclase [Gemmatimonadota bacterium]